MTDRRPGRTAGKRTAHIRWQAPWHPGSADAWTIQWPNPTRRHRRNHSRRMPSCTLWRSQSCLQALHASFRRVRLRANSLRKGGHCKPVHPHPQSTKILCIGVGRLTATHFISMRCAEALERASVRFEIWAAVSCRHKLCRCRACRMTSWFVEYSYAQQPACRCTSIACECFGTA